MNIRRLKMKSRRSERAKEIVFDVNYGVFVWCISDKYKLGRGILSMKLRLVEGFV